MAVLKPTLCVMEYVMAVYVRFPVMIVPNNIMHALTCLRLLADLLEIPSSSANMNCTDYVRLKQSARVELSLNRDTANRKQAHCQIEQTATS